MSWQAAAFMILTMGGVLALNVLCIYVWIRGPKHRPAAARPRPENPEPSAP